MISSFLKAYIFTRRSGALVRIIGWISLVGAALSVVAMVVVTSVMQGFGGGIRDRLLAVEPHVVVELSSEQPDYANVASLVQDINKIEKAKAHLYETQDLMIRTVDGLYSGAAGHGIDSGTLKNILEGLDVKRRKTKRDQLRLDPRDFSPDTYDLKKGEVVIGVDLANALAIFEGDEIVIVSPEALLLPPGESIRFEKVRVKSILRSNVPHIDAQTVFYGLGESLRTIRYSPIREKKIEVRSEDPLNLNSITAFLVSKKIKYQTWSERNSSLFYSLKMEKFLMTLFLGLTLLIGSFSIVTLLVLLSTQKREDIGMMQAMGMSPKNVRRLFAGMGVGITTVGMGAGLLIGLIACWWLDHFPIIKLPDIYYDTDLPVSVDYQTIIGVSVIVFIVSSLSSWFATKATSKLTPVQALRFKK